LSLAISTSAFERRTKESDHLSPEAGCAAPLQMTRLLVGNSSSASGTGKLAAVRCRLTRTPKLCPLGAMDETSQNSLDAFLTTRWSLVAGGGRDGSRREALEWLCAAYWRPLYGHVRRKGHDHEAALDFTQGFFAALLAGEPFAGVERGKGRFRAWMLAALNHFLLNEHDRAAALKRGGRKATLAIEQLQAAGNQNWEPADPSLPPDREFDRRWALAVMDQALTAVEKEYAKRGAADQFALLKPFLAGRADAGNYDALAKNLGTTPNNVAAAVKRLRERFRDRVKQAVMDTVGSAEDLDSEMAHLFAALRGG
jgi:RNA polymerase sigma-70 factor (ECF subfamily)